MRTLASLAAALTLFCAPADAAELSGRDLADACQAGEAEQALCLGYIQGFIDGYGRNDTSLTGFIRDNLRSGHLRVAAADRRINRLTYCVDEKVPAEVVRGDYLAWAATDPTGLYQPAAAALFDALAETYPCFEGESPSADAATTGDWRTNG